MKYWILTANIDGYRCDAADYVPFSFWKQAIDSLKKMPNRKLILLAEGGRSDHFTAGFQMNFGWSFYEKVLNVFKYNHYAYGIYSTHIAETGNLAANAYKLRFTSNHDKCAYDNTPLVNYGGKRGSMAAFVITSFMGGIPLIYNGQEVGCPNKLPITSKLPINWTTNPDMLLEYKFLMDFRHNHPAMRYGNLESFSDKDFVAFKRSLGHDQVFVLVNTGNSPEHYTVPSSIQNSTWQNFMTGAMETFGNNMLLNPYEYRIYHN
jgi:glycosidase